MAEPASQHLRVQAGEYVIDHSQDGGPPPSAGWVALVQAPEGLTIVRRATSEDPAERRWIAFYGGSSAHDLDVPGMLAALVHPLAQAAVPVFVTSTYHADLVFVPAARREDAAGILRRAGHVVCDSARAGD